MISTHALPNPRVTAGTWQGSWQAMCPPISLARGSATSASAATGRSTSAARVGTLSFRAILVGARPRPGQALTSLEPCSEAVSEGKTNGTNHNGGRVPLQRWLANTTQTSGIATQTLIAVHPQALIQTMRSRAYANNTRHRLTSSARTTSTNGESWCERLQRRRRSARRSGSARPLDLA